MAVVRNLTFDRPIPADSQRVLMAIADNQRSGRAGMHAWLASDAAQGDYWAFPIALKDGVYRIAHIFSDAPTAVAFRLRWS